MTKLEIKTMREVREELSTFYGMDFILKRAEYIDRLDKKLVSVESLIELRKSLERKINKVNNFFDMKGYRIESKGKLLTVNEFLQDELNQLKELGE